MKQLLLLIVLSLHSTTFAQRLATNATANLALLAEQAGLDSSAPHPLPTPPQQQQQQQLPPINSKIYTVVERMTIYGGAQATARAVMADSRRAQGEDDEGDHDQGEGEEGESGNSALPPRKRKRDQAAANIFATLRGVGVLLPSLRYLLLLPYRLLLLLRYPLSALLSALSHLLPWLWYPFSLLLSPILLPLSWLLSLFSALQPLLLYSTLALTLGAGMGVVAGAVGGSGIAPKRWSWSWSSDGGEGRRLGSREGGEGKKEEASWEVRGAGRQVGMDEDEDDDDGYGEARRSKGGGGSTGISARRGAGAAAVARASRTPVGGMGGVPRWLEKDKEMGSGVGVGRRGQEAPPSSRWSKGF